MVKQVKASLTCFVLFLLVIATSMISIVHSKNTMIIPTITENQVKSWQRKTRMNHGSHRGGSRKHLVKPTAEDSFQLAREFPV
ncbi:unnamed protein product [Vicia faba]|uniref:Transmembrane protein n=1 Tax=Vicia faba TaxID=3906 RepID=A0AAV0YQU6_VICFA|nr:unnamed protein product [Vicia faba]